MQLGSLMATKSGSVDPSKFPTESFDLYSIPAFDRGEPDVVVGSAIGSSKQIVEPGDVLLSRIVPHIRRAQVVGCDQGRRIIASGEWIVFRSDKFHPEYLRHVLVGDPFHAQFMNTVAGVGGSLLRARPTHVATIAVPLPPLPEQRRIATILDQVDALRAERRAALAQLDKLTQAVRVEMFGSPTANPKGYPVATMIELVDPKRPITYGILKPGDDIPDGVPYVRVVDMTDRSIHSAGLRRTTEAISSQYKRSLLRESDLLMSIRGHVGRLAMVEADVAGANITQDTARLAITGADPTYVLECLRSLELQRWMKTFTKGAAVRGINLTDVKRIQIPLPPASDQSKFAHAAKGIERNRQSLLVSTGQLDLLFASLQHRAFRGEL